MAAPKDQLPVRGHYAQAVLYEAGVSGVGVDAASKLHPTEVRRHGVRQIGKRGMQLVLGTGLVAGLAVGALRVGGNAVDYEINRVDPGQSQDQPVTTAPESESTQIGANFGPNENVGGALPQGAHSAAEQAPRDPAVEAEA